MKKPILFFILITFATFAQSPKDSTQVNTEMYLGIGAQIQNLNINQKLSISSLPNLPETMPEFIIGFNVFGKKYSGSLEFSGIYNNQKSNNLRTQYITANFRGNAHYNILNKSKVAFTTGLNLAFGTTEFDIFDQSSQINLNNLNPNNNIGSIALKNKMFYVGPSASLYLFKNKSSKIRFNLAYEFALSRGRWESDFGNVVNSVNERGNNRLVFGLLFQ